MLRSAAQRASSWRLLSCSLRSTAEAWVSTVFSGDHEVFGDLLVGVAAGEQLEDLALARGQAGELVVDLDDGIDANASST